MAIFALEPKITERGQMIHEVPEVCRIRQGEEGPRGGVGARPLLLLSHRH